MATEGYPSGVGIAPRGLRERTRRQPRRPIGRLVLLGVCGFLGCAAFTVASADQASADELDRTGQPLTSELVGERGLASETLDGIGETTGSLAEGPAERDDRNSSAGAASQDEGPRDAAEAPSATRGDRTAGRTLVTDTGATLRSLGRHEPGTRDVAAPVRAAVKPLAEATGAPADRLGAAAGSSLSAAAGDRGALLDELAAKIEPVTDVVSVTVAVPVAMTTGGGAPAAASTGGTAGATHVPDVQVRGTHTGHPAAPTAETADPAVGGTADRSHVTALVIPAGSTGAGAPLSPDRRNLPTNTSAPSAVGNGSGGVGALAFAEPTWMLAAWRPTAVHPHTDADISTGSEGRPSVSPD